MQVGLRKWVRFDRSGMPQHPATFGLSDTWFQVVCNMPGETTVIQADKHVITQALGVQIRDLRLLDPQLSTSYPSAILCREQALVRPGFSLSILAIAHISPCYICSMQVMLCQAQCEARMQVVNLEHIKCIIAVDHVLVLNADEVQAFLSSSSQKPCFAQELSICWLLQSQENVIQFIEELQRRLRPVSVSIKSPLQYTLDLSRQSLIAGRALLWQCHS